MGGGGGSCAPDAAGADVDVPGACGGGGMTASRCVGTRRLCARLSESLLPLVD